MFRVRRDATITWKRGLQSSNPGMIFLPKAPIITWSRPLIHPDDFIFAFSNDVNEQKTILTIFHPQIGSIDILQEISIPHNFIDFAYVPTFDHDFFYFLTGANSVVKYKLEANAATMDKRKGENVNDSDLSSSLVTPMKFDLTFNNEIMVAPNTIRIVIISSLDNIIQLTMENCIFILPASPSSSSSVVASAGVMDQKNFSLGSCPSLALHGKEILGSESQILNMIFISDIVGTVRSFIVNSEGFKECWKRNFDRPVLAIKSDPMNYQQVFLAFDQSYFRISAIDGSIMAKIQLDSFLTCFHPYSLSKDDSFARIYDFQDKLLWLTKTESPVLSVSLAKIKEIKGYLVTLDENVTISVCHLKTSRDAIVKSQWKRTSLHSKLPIQTLCDDLEKMQMKNHIVPQEKEIPKKDLNFGNLIDLLPETNLKMDSSKRCLLVRLIASNKSNEAISNVSIHVETSHQFKVKPGNTFNIDFISAGESCCISFEMDLETRHGLYDFSESVDIVLLSSLPEIFIRRKVAIPFKFFGEFQCDAAGNSVHDENQVVLEYHLVGGKSRCDPEILSRLYPELAPFPKKGILYFNFYSSKNEKVTVTSQEDGMKLIMSGTSFEGIIVPFRDLKQRLVSKGIEVRYPEAESLIKYFESNLRSNIMARRVKQQAEEKCKALDDALKKVTKQLLAVSTNFLQGHNECKGFEGLVELIMNHKIEALKEIEQLQIDIDICRLRYNAGLELILESQGVSRSSLLEFLFIGSQVLGDCEWERVVFQNLSQVAQKTLKLVDPNGTDDNFDLKVFSSMLHETIKKLR